MFVVVVQSVPEMSYQSDITNKVTQSYISPYQYKLTNYLETTIERNEAES